MKGGGSALDWGVPTPCVVNETKAGIVTAMRELGDATTSYELYAIWGGAKALSIFEYHLSTLVIAGVVEIVVGPELRFRLKDTAGAGSIQRTFRDGCRGRRGS